MTNYCPLSFVIETNDNRRLGDLKFMSRMRSAVEWSKQMDLDDEEKAGVDRGERQRGTWEEVITLYFFFSKDDLKRKRHMVA